MTTASTAHAPEQQETTRMIQMLRKEACSGAIADLSHVRTEHCVIDCLTKRSANPKNLMDAVKVTNISIVHVTLRAQCRLYVSHVMFRLKPHPRQTVAAVVKVCRLWLGRSGVEKCRVDHKIGSKTFMVAELLAKASS